MRSLSRALIVLLVLVSQSQAQVAPREGRRVAQRTNVPDSVLQALGLSDLEVDPSQRDPEELPTPAQPTARPADRPPADTSASPGDNVPAQSAASKIPVRQPPPEPRITEAQRQAVAKATTAAKAAAGKYKAAEQALASAKSEFEQAEKLAALGDTAVKQAQQDLKSVRATTAAAIDRYNKTRQQAGTLSAAGMAMAERVKKQKELVEALAPIQKELKKVAGEFDDKEVAEALANLDKMWTGKKETTAADELKLAEMLKTFQAANRAFLAAQSTAQKSQQALKAAEATLASINQQVAAANASVEQKRKAAATAATAAQASKTALEAAQKQLQLATAAAQPNTVKPAVSEGPASKATRPDPATKNETPKDNRQAVSVD